MINRRKKTYRNTDKDVFNAHYQEEWDGDERGSKTIQGFDPRTLGGSLKPLADGQLDAIQTASNERQDAEESNLDILDRGSRYKRKSDKLKKFKG